jgi:thiol-disulfide isomerase/thioredoxin
MTKLASVGSVLGLTLLLALGCAAAAPAPPTGMPEAQSGEAPGGLTPATGARVGERAPEFAINLADGSTVTSAELMAQGRPTFLYFFATWWPVCRAELQRMKEVYPDFAGSVDFYAVGSDPTEALERLESFRQGQGHPWPVATVQGTLLRDLEVLVQSTKVAINSEGVIVYRSGYGQGGPEEWRRVFAGLAESAKE